MTCVSESPLTVPSSSPLARYYIQHCLWSLKYTFIFALALNGFQFTLNFLSSELIKLYPTRSFSENELWDEQQ